MIMAEMEKTHVTQHKVFTNAIGNMEMDSQANQQQIKGENK